MRWSVSEKLKHVKDRNVALDIVGETIPNGIYIMIPAIYQHWQDLLGVLINLVGIFLKLLNSFWAARVDINCLEGAQILNPVLNAS